MRGTPSLRFVVSPARPVHPRVCGEHPGKVKAQGVKSRSIPACAGNTVLQCLTPTLGPGPSPRVRGTRSVSAVISPATAVHPRVCGEHDAAIDARLLRVRSIPACAGNTIVPRTRGGRLSGPSPRVRGTPETCVLRISAFSVHPRVCGEHELPSAMATLQQRSIPACAGNTRHVPMPGLSDQRSIPACAGNTLLIVLAAKHRSGPSPRVRGTLPKGAEAQNPLPGPSPRVRGTPLVQHGRVTLLCGPSPRVRGTPLQGGSLAPPDRSIPACAGNTIATQPCNALFAVHPRVCGEHG